MPTKAAADRPTTLVGTVDKENRLTRLCIGFAAATALWSLWTTFRGMDLVVGSVIGALMFSVVVQLWLLGVSLELGADLTHQFLDLPARRTRHLTIFLWASFGLTFACSVLFSYVNFINNTYRQGQDKLVDQSNATALLQKILPDLRGQVLTTRRNNVARLVNDNADVSAWLRDIEKVQKAAGDPANQQGLRDHARLADEAKKSLVELQRRLADIKERRKKLSELEAKQAAATIERKTAENNRDAELDPKRALKGIKGQGPKYREFQRKAQEALEKERSFNPEIEHWKQMLAGPQNDEQTVQASIDAAEKAVKEAGNSNAPDTTDYAGELTRALRNFTTDPSPGTYGAVVSACGRAQKALSALSMRPGASAMLREATATPCDRTLIDTSVKDRVAELPKFDKFDEACSDDAVNLALTTPLSEQETSDRLLKRAQVRAQLCVSRAPLSTKSLEDFQAKLNSFVESQDVGTDKLKLAVVALLRDPLHALISLIFALFQDAFVLVAGIGAEYFKRRDDEVHPGSHIDFVVRESDHPLVAARKLLLDLAAEETNGSYLVGLDTPEWKAQQEKHGPNLTQLLKELSSKGMAKLVPHGDGQAYRINRHGRQELVRSLRSASPPSESTASRSGQSASGGAARGKPLRAGSRREILDELVPGSPTAEDLVAPDGKRAPDGRTRGKAAAPSREEILEHLLRVPPIGT